MISYEAHAAIKVEAHWSVNWVLLIPSFVLLFLVSALPWSGSELRIRLHFYLFSICIH